MEADDETVFLISEVTPSLPSTSPTEVKGQRQVQNWALDCEETRFCRRLLVKSVVSHRPLK